MIRLRRNKASGMAIPIVIAIVLILAVAATSLHIMMQQGRQQITTIVDEIVLLNVTEAILDKVICTLKKASWGSRWYKEERQHAFGGSSDVLSGDESGVYINDLGYDGIDYYYHIEDVTYRDHYGANNIPVGKNIDPDDIVPYLARLHIQATYKQYEKTIQCELKFREPARLEPTMMYVQNYKIIPNPNRLDLSETEGLAALKARGQEIFEKAREDRVANEGLSTMIEMVERLKLKPGGELTDANNMEKFAGTEIDEAQSTREKRIAEFIRKAKQVFRDFEVEKLNVEPTSTVGPQIDYDEAIGYMVQAVKLTNGLPLERKRERFPECLYYLGVCYAAKGDVTAGPSIKNGISDPDPVRQATIPLVTDHGEQFWLDDSPPAGILAGSGIVDTDTGFSERSYYFKLAESCFSTIIRRYSDSRYIPRSYVKLYQTKLALSCRWGRAYGQNEARKVMKALKKKINNGKYPAYYRVFDEDLRILDVFNEIYLLAAKQKIVYALYNNVNAELYIANADGSGTPINFTNNPTDSFFPSWSPDGNRIAFRSDRDTNYEIYMANADGSGTPVNLTNNPAWDSYPSWSPDGKQLSFSSNRDGNWEIYVINVNGSGTPVNITNNPAIEFVPSWSPDGKRLAFESKRDGNFEIYTANTDGSGVPVNISNNPAYDTLPSWSSDSNRIVFRSERDGNGEVYISNADGSGAPVNITNNPAWEMYPSWSPDGTRIVFSSDRSGNEEIYIANTDGSGVPVKLISYLGFDTDLAWSPDNNRIAYCTDDGNEIINIVDADSSTTAVNLTYTPILNFPSWSPNGKQIALVSYRDDNVEIYIARADDSGAPVKLINYSSVKICAPAWSPIIGDPFPDIFGH